MTDGASDGFDSRRWARMLAAEWKLNHPGFMLNPDQLCEEIVGLAERWKKTWQNRNLPWYLEEKQKTGAYATFLGVEIESDQNTLRWRAIAVGDSCLFIQNKENKLVASFPLLDEEEFSNFPVLISTNLNDQAYIRNYIRRQSGTLDAGDTLLLMTDAISSWFMRVAKSDFDKQMKFTSFLTQKNHESLENLIDLERGNQSLRNDDIAIISISVNKE